MKTLKTLTVITLVAAFSLAPMSNAWAHHGHHGHHRGHHGHHGGDIAGAAIGGTMLGLVLGSAMSQPAQPAQPQVVVVQPNSNDTTTVQHYQALELERERAKNIALEQELARIRANSR